MTAYVANVDNDTVTVIDLATGSSGKVIPVGSLGENDPTAVAIG